MLARPDRTRDICRGVSRHLIQRGYAVVTEMTFSNGRRADLFAVEIDFDDDLARANARS